MPVPPREVVNVELALQVPELMTAMPEEFEVSMPVPPKAAPIAVPFHVPCTTVPRRELVSTERKVVEALVASRFPIVEEAMFKTVAEDVAVLKRSWPVTASEVVVAFVVVELKMERFVIVEEELFATKPPDVFTEKRFVPALF